FVSYQSITVNASGGDGARRYRAAKAEPPIFELSRTKPLLGREFNARDDQPGAEDVVVIGYDVWQSQFGGNENVLDQALRISGKNHRVVGVMPPGYLFPDNTDLWIPLRMDPLRIPRGKGELVEGVAILEKDQSAKNINRQLTVIMQRMAE